MKQNVDEILKQGIHGPKEIKPEERRRFLGTLRERVVLALFCTQVNETGVYPEVEHTMVQHPSAKLYLNGRMNYDTLSKYIKIAKKHQLSFKMVSNKEYNSDIGLLIAYDYAVDQPEIFVQKKESAAQPVKKKRNPVRFLKRCLRYILRKTIRNRRMTDDR